MCAVMRLLTAFALVLPAVFIGLGLASPPPVGALLRWVGAGIAVLYVFIWLAGRPTRFELTAAELVLIWPIRSRRIPRSDIRAVRQIRARAFRREFGWAARIGAGGLFGGFGWLYTSRGGLFDLYVSRIDEWVLVERVSGRPLLLNPEPAADFVAALSPV